MGVDDPTLRIQIGQRRQYLKILGRKIGVIYILGSRTVDSVDSKKFEQGPGTIYVFILFWVWGWNTVALKFLASTGYIVDTVFEPKVLQTYGLSWVLMHGVTHPDPPTQFLSGM